MRGPSRATICRSIVAVIAIAAAASLLDILRHPVEPLAAEPASLGIFRAEQDLVALLERRYAPLRSLLPEHGVVGYVGSPPTGLYQVMRLAEYRYAVYTLAPLIVDRTPDHPIVIANFPRERALRQFLASRDEFEITARLGAGLAVLHRRRP